MLGFGGAPIGFAEPGREDSFLRLIRRAVELGITFFDTAPDYRHSEALLGRALRGWRGQVVLATKVGRLQSRSADGWQVHEDWTESGVQATVERSLRRLETDYLDLVQLHSPPRWVLDHGAALRALLRAQQAGKVRHLGISADGDDARRALEFGTFSTLQVSYSILQQEPAADLLPAAADLGIGIIAKQPLANGIPALPERPAPPDWSRKWDLAQHIDWGSTAGPARLALALRWLLSDPRVSTAIVGTTRLEHLAANVAAALAGPCDAEVQRHFAQQFVAARAADRVGAEDEP